MLEQQLPALVPIDGFLDRLEAALDWISEVSTPVPALVQVPIASDEQLVTRDVVVTGHRGRLDAIRFAGTNRLLVAFDYNGTRRLVEPYSLRQRTGNLLLYAWERGPEQIKAFNLAKIFNAESVATSFQPRYRVEFG